MKELAEVLRFMFFAYWNNPEDIAAGYRSAVIFFWMFLLAGVLIPVSLFIFGK